MRSRASSLFTNRYLQICIHYFRIIQHEISALIRLLCHNIRLWLNLYSRTKLVGYLPTLTDKSLVEYSILLFMSRFLTENFKKHLWTIAICLFIFQVTGFPEPAFAQIYPAFSRANAFSHPKAMAAFEENVHFGRNFSLTQGLIE
jgi:hypothetical protein